jgi:hypothetical protein
LAHLEPPGYHLKGPRNENPKIIGIGDKMRIHLTNSWTLTDEHPLAERGNPILIDLGTWQVYHPRDRIGDLSALQFVSLAVEARGKNDFLPEEIQFISRFKEETHEIQSGHEAEMSRTKNHQAEMIFLRGFNPSGRA